MSVRKKRLNTNFIVWDVANGEPLYSPLYEVGRQEWDSWKEALGNRCGWDWKRGKRMLKWRRGNQRRWLGPKIRKRPNNRFRLRWSVELIEDKVAELKREGVPVNYPALASKLNVSVFCLFKRLAKLKMKLGGNRPLNLHGAPPSVDAFKIG
jgi:hypothetical protein